MNKKYFVAVAVLVSSVFIFAGCSNSNGGQKTVTPVNNNTLAEPAVQPKTEPVVQLSEQPNTDEFNKYFSEIYLGKLAIGKQVGPPDNIPAKTDVFSKTTDEFCVSVTVFKDIPASIGASGVYDVVAKTFTTAEPKAKFSRNLTQGNSIGCGGITLPVGKYEYKTYVNNILVSVLPFEVK